MTTTAVHARAVESPARDPVASPERAAGEDQASPARDPASQARDLLVTMAPGVMTQARMMEAGAMMPHLDLASLERDPTHTEVPPASLERDHTHTEGPLASLERDHTVDLTTADGEVRVLSIHLSLSIEISKS